MRRARRRRTLEAAGVMTLAVLVADPEAAAGQYDEPPPPAAWALRGVTVVAADGSRTEDVTVVVRNGLVERLTPGGEVPGDARVLRGEGLFVHPGLVDANGHAAVSWPDPVDDDEVTSWDPPRSRQGFLPHRRVADHLNGAGIEARRASGTVAALVHPTGGLAPGQPAVVVYRAGTAAPRELVAVESGGLSMGLQGARGVYPSQLFAVIAFLRQAFMDAERWEARRGAFAEDPRGMTAPPWDPDFEALLRAARGEWPVYFFADSDEDITRAFELADEFGLRLVLVGGDEAWKKADELRRRQIPVLVSLDFPRPDEWDPETDTVGAELDPGAARERERLENIWSNAGRLEQAGVTVALTSGGGVADLVEGTRKTVEYGLSPDGALQALTTTPATLLGIPWIAEVRESGPATFIVTTGELLDADSEVAYTFVEGALERGEGAPGGTAQEAPAGDVTGTWEGEIGAQGESMPLTLTLTQDEDGTLDGTVEGGRMPSSPVSGRVSGTAVTIRIEAAGMPRPITIRATLSGDGEEMRGTGTSPFGELAFTARRRPAHEEDTP